MVLTHRQQRRALQRVNVAHSIFEQLRLLRRDNAALVAENKRLKAELAGMAGTAGTQEQQKPQRPTRARKQASAS